MSLPPGRLVPLRQNALETLLYIAPDGDFLNEFGAGVGWRVHVPVSVNNP